MNATQPTVEPFVGSPQTVIHTEAQQCRLPPLSKICHCKNGITAIVCVCLCWTNVRCGSQELNGPGSAIRRNER